MSTRPSACNAMQLIAPSTPIPGSKAASTEPLAFKRAMRLRAESWIALKSPPTMILPRNAAAAEAG